MKKPVKPKKKNMTYVSYYIQYKDTLQDILDGLEIDKTFDFDNIHFEDDYVYCYTYESDEDYEIRLNNYEKELVLYNKWYSENKAEIEQKRNAKKEKEIQRKLELINKQLSKLTSEKNKLIGNK